MDISFGAECKPRGGMKQRHGKMQQQLLQQKILRGVHIHFCYHFWL
jgi:hypothetical protein